MSNDDAAQSDKPQRSFLERAEWTVEEALRWAIGRIKTSLDCGEYFAKAEAALLASQQRETEKVEALLAPRSADVTVNQERVRRIANAYFGTDRHVELCVCAINKALRESHLLVAPSPEVLVAERDAGRAVALSSSEGTINEKVIAEAERVAYEYLSEGDPGDKLNESQCELVCGALLDLIRLRSATGASKEFAARVRPAVAAWVNKCDRSALNPTFPKHYGPLLRSEADKAHALLEEIDTMIGDAPECSHYWIPNSGKGGEPEFRLNSQMGTEPVMHVMCSLCNTRTWFTEKQWWAIPATVEPHRLDSTAKEKP